MRGMNLAATGATLALAVSTAPAAAADVDPQRAVADGAERGHSFDIGQQAGPLAVAGNVQENAPVTYTAAGANTSGTTVTYSASSRRYEGSDGNSLSCDRITTKRRLMHLANGGKDSCGHDDIGKIWRADGITPEVASKMVYVPASAPNAVCYGQGWLSRGRGPSPRTASGKSLDVPMKLPGLNTPVNGRPLDVWGKTCYDAWKGLTEDGQPKAILVGCANDLRKRKIVVPHHTPKSPKTGDVYVNKSAVDTTGDQFPFAPDGAFSFTGTCKGIGNKTLRRTITYNDNIDHANLLLKGCKINTTATVVENPELSGNWKPVSPQETIGPDGKVKLAQAKVKVRRSDRKKFTNVASFKDIEVDTPPSDICVSIPGNQIQVPEGYVINEQGVCVPITSPPPVAPPPPPVVPPNAVCTPYSLSNKDGSVTTGTTGTEGAISELFDKDTSDNVPAVATNPNAPEHTDYPGDGDYTISYVLGFANGAVAKCSAVVQSRTSNVPPPPEAKSFWASNTIGNTIVTSNVGEGAVA